MIEWNKSHRRANRVRHPDNPELEDALNHFRQVFEYYDMQVTRGYKIINTIPVQEHWDHYLKLRKLHNGNAD